MSKKVKVNIQGKEIDGELLEFTTEKEDWNSYITEDGSKIRLKVVVSRIIRTDQLNASGEPMYVVNSANLVDSELSDAVRELYSKSNEDVPN